MSDPAWLRAPVAGVEFVRVRPELLPALRKTARKHGGRVSARATDRNSPRKDIRIEFTGDGLQDRRAAFLEDLAPLRRERDATDPNAWTLLPSNLGGAQ